MTTMQPSQTERVPAPAVPAPTGVLADLVRAPWSFEPVQAVRVLERAAGSNPADAVRFQGVLPLAFPASAMAGARLGQVEGAPAVLRIAHLGLLGPSGVLPSHMTAAAIEAERRRNPGFARFVDLFLDRQGAFFHGAQAKYRLALAHERAAAEGREDAITGALRALTGLGTPHLAGRLAVDDLTVIRHAGHFARGPRSAAALEAMLAGQLGAPVRIRQFAGSWVRLDEAERSRLTPGGFCRLGVDMVAGEKVRDVDGRFEIVIGPLPRARFAALLPEGAAVRALTDLVRLYVGPAMSFALRLVLDRHEVPPAELGAKGGLRLGWTGWLTGTAPPPRDPDDAVFETGA